MKLINVIALFAFLNYSLTFSQEELSFEQAKNIALRNCYSVQIEKNFAIIASNNNSFGNAGFLPSVDLLGNYTKSTQNVKQNFFSGQSIEKTGASSKSLLATAEVNWQIFDGMKMFATKEMLETLDEAALEELQKNMEQTALDVYQLYYDIVTQNTILSATEQAIDFSAERLRIFDERFQLGSSSKLDFLQAKVYYNSDKSDKLQIESRIQQLQYSLNELLARDPETQFVVTDSIDMNKHLEFSVLLDYALKRNKDIILAEKSISAAKNNVTISESMYYPNIRLFANYELSDSRSESGFMARNTSLSFRYGVNFSMNLFNGMNTSIQSQNARIMLENNELLFSQTKLRVVTELRIAYSRYSKQLEIVELENENVIAAKEALDIAYEQLKLGTYSPLDLREAQKTYVQASSRLVSAKYNYKQSQAELLRISGLLLE